ncbi:MAG: hypothetical protein WCK17_09055 [Verrucomicrobiota bacterium]
MTLPARVPHQRNLSKAEFTQRRGMTREEAAMYVGVKAECP